MKLANFFKLSLSLIPITNLSLSFLCTSCKNGDDPTPPEPPAPINPVSITEPEEHESESDLKKDGSTQIFFKNFQYTGMDDVSKLTVGGNFDNGDTIFQYSIEDFDIYQKTFDVVINVANGTPIEKLSGQFAFTYENNPIIPQLQSDFYLSLNPTKVITLPEIKEAAGQIVNNKASVKFINFECDGIDDISEITVLFSGNPTLGETKTTHIEDFDGQHFSVVVYFENVAAEIVHGQFDFYFGSSRIDVAQDTFSCELLRQTDKPKFEEDSWWQVIKYAADGLSALQDHYGIASFVGLQRKINISTGSFLTPIVSYPVTVIGQNHDHYESKNPVALTFQFNDVINKYDEADESYDPYKIYWDINNKYKWYNPDTNEQCTLREYLRTNVLDAMDWVVAENIKPVMKETIEFDGTTKPIESKETIWTPSLSEIGFSTDDFIKEGECYEYYLPTIGHEKDILRTATIVNTDGTEKVNYWCRTPYHLCNTDGEARQTQSYSCCIRPCFCI